MDFLTIVLILVSLLLFVYYYLGKKMNHFKKLGVPHDSPVPILGNMAPVVFRRICMVEHLSNLYYRHSNVKYCGFYNFASPVFVIRDPELITSITVKNFDQFCDHQAIVDPELDPLMGKNLFSLRGDHWREMRKLLSPAFTSSKMRAMYKLIWDCAENFVDFIVSESKEGKVYDLKDIFGRYTTDVIATCSFGHTLDSMRNPDNQFYVFARNALKFTIATSFKIMIARSFPKLSKFLGIRIITDKAHCYFQNIVAETVKLRDEKGIYRPDMIQLLMEFRDKDGKRLTIEEITSQAFVFFTAGFDTIAVFLCYASHQLAAMPDVQARLRAEIEDVLQKYEGMPTYEAIRDMPYLDAVMNEVLRMYVLPPYLDRVCVKDFELPSATPDSRPITVKPGDVMWFLPFPMHRDSKYYPDPLKFCPERFLDKKVSQSTFIPFGLGPRVCIGNRFALMEVKILFLHLLLRCELEPCSKTPIPMKFSTKSFGLLPEGGFWLKFKARKNREDAGDKTVQNGTSAVY
ncbi:cytochrome P450 9e2-like [Calliopsis andreniformis]|uniref:cytochrome P450 9e2-like n=1 Tax=Calliopsis andreniformis TaxID=337506 RepID=UPI003FCC381C